MSVKSYPWNPCTRCKSQDLPHYRLHHHPTGYHPWCVNCQRECAGKRQANRSFEAMYRRMNERAIAKKKLKVSQGESA